MLFPVQNKDCKPLQTTIMVERHKLAIEVNTGAAVSLVSEEIVNSLFSMCMSSTTADECDITYVYTQDNCVNTGPIFYQGRLVT